MILPEGEIAIPWSSYHSPSSVAVPYIVHLSHLLVHGFRKGQAKSSTYLAIGDQQFGAPCTNVDAAIVFKYYSLNARTILLRNEEVPFRIESYMTRRCESANENLGLIPGGHYGVPVPWPRVLALRRHMGQLNAGKTGERCDQGRHDCRDHCPRRYVKGRNELKCISR